MTTLYCTRSDCPKVAAKSSTSNLTPSCSLESIDVVPHFTFEEDCHSVSCLDDFTPLKLQDVPQENLASCHLKLRNQVSAAFRATMNQQDPASSPAADKDANVNSVTIDNRSENELVRSQQSSAQTVAPSYGSFLAQFHGELVVNKAVGRRQCGNSQCRGTRSSRSRSRPLRSLTTKERGRSIFFTRCCCKELATG